MKQALRLFHTVRYLKPKQIAYRLYYRWHRLTVPSLPSQTQARKWQQGWYSPQWQDSCINTDGKFHFPNETGAVNKPQDWNNPTKSKLWLYNLHYLDELNTRAADQRASSINALINRWIEENPAPHGNGWEPYPLSLRLVNLVKWQMRQHDSGSQLLNSIHHQASALCKQIEYHIMANHLFANGKALVFAGAALAQSDKFLQQGLKILDTEIPEQFLVDGGHFELSPMYHAILLWDMCDLLNLAKISAIPALLDRQSAWPNVIEKGLDWLAAMTHPDGDIAFFNDSTLGIAPRYDDLCQYATLLGIHCPTRNPKNLAATHLKESGYIIVESEVAKLILDVGEVGVSYQPGHAHADTLSFELSLFGQRVFVNSGISQYGIGSERQYQRSTQAHNTVVIDGKNSSDVWGGFRVGQRAYPKQLQLTPTNDKITVNCAHNGYQQLIHSRQWALSNQHCQLTDTVSGEYQQAEAHFYLHPSIQIQQLTENHAQLKLADGQLISITFANHAALRIDHTHWYPGFGLTQNNQCLIATLTKKPLTTDITW